MSKTILIFSFILCLVACKNEPKLSIQDIEKREMARGVRYDSLLLGLSLGMPAKEFYLRCWDLNKQGIIREGNTNMTVMYKLTEGLKYQAYLNFYPNFYNDKIYEMPYVISYVGWSPWRTDNQPESLQLDVVKLLEKWYGTGFIRVYDLKRGLTFVKVDGNRRIKVMQKPEMYVEVIITDLIAEKEKLKLESAK
jgi:hypothetical protein